MICVSPSGLLLPLANLPMLTVHLLHLLILEGVLFKEVIIHHMGGRDLLEADFELHLFLLSLPYQVHGDVAQLGQDVVLQLLPPSP